MPQGLKGYDAKLQNCMSQYLKWHDAKLQNCMTQGLNGMTQDLKWYDSKLQNDAVLQICCEEEKQFCTQYRFEHKSSGNRTVDNVNLFAVYEFGEGVVVE